MSGYDPNKSQVSDDKLAQWIQSNLSEEVTQVPGVGPKNAELLAAAGVETPYQLIGQFLVLRAPGMNTQAHCDAFYNWLQSAGISSYRGGIVKAIAEKVNMFMPGIYNEGELTKELQLDHYFELHKKLS